MCVCILNGKATIASSVFIFSFNRVWNWEQMGNFCLFIYLFSFPAVSRLNTHTNARKHTHTHGSCCFHRWLWQSISLGGLCSFSAQSSVKAPSVKVSVNVHRPLKSDYSKSSQSKIDCFQVWTDVLFTQLLNDSVRVFVRIQQHLMNSSFWGQSESAAVIVTSHLYLCFCLWSFALKVYAHAFLNR